MIANEPGPTFTEVVVRPHGLEAAYWPPAATAPSWRSLPAPANEAWRGIIDLPVTLGEDVTVGSFVKLFDNAEPDQDERLFFAFTSLPEGGFAPWVKAASDTTHPPLPNHLKAVEVEVDVRTLPDGSVVGQYLPWLSVVSEGSVDDPFWEGVSRFPWYAGDFPLAQLASLPLRLGASRPSGSGPAFQELTLRQLIQCVFHWCPPANRSSDLPDEARARIIGEIEICTESLAELLGVHP